MSEPIITQWGHKHYTVTDVVWNPDEHVGTITYEDDDGTVFCTETSCMARHEVKAAVDNDILDRYRRHVHAVDGG